MRDVMLSQATTFSGLETDWRHWYDRHRLPPSLILVGHDAPFLLDPPPPAPINPKPPVLTERDGHVYFRGVLLVCLCDIAVLERDIFADCISEITDKAEAADTAQTSSEPESTPKPKSQKGKVRR